MTPMRIRALLSSEKDRAVIVLEDVEQRLRLAFSADLHEVHRLGRVLGSAECACNPVYDFIEALLGALKATVRHIVLDDAGDLGVGAVVCLERADAGLTVRCYPPDALALALRAKVPIYASAEVLAHARPLAGAGDVPPLAPMEAERWLERVRPGDFR